MLTNSLVQVFSRRLIYLINRFLFIHFILAPILVAVGYVNAGRELTQSVILSVGLDINCNYYPRLRY